MFLLVLFVAVGTMTSSVSAASQHEVTVGMDSSAIQAIIDAAGIGDTINFATGVYNDLSLTINKTLNIIGNGATILQSNSSKIIFNVAEQQTDNPENTVINGFNLSGGRPIVVSGTNNITVTNNNISLASYTDGISLSGILGGLIENNSINGNNIGRNGFNIGGSSFINFNSNNVSDVTYDGISIFQGAHDINFTNNKFINQPFGIFFGGGVHDINLWYNEFTNSSDTAIDLFKSIENVSIIGNNITGGFFGIVLKEGDSAHGGQTVLDFITVLNNHITNNNLGIVIYNVTSLDKLPNFESNNISGNTYGNVAMSSDNITETDGSPDVSISDSMSKTVVKNGDTLTYTITVKNTGTKQATNVKVNGLPSSYYSSAVTYSSVGSYSNGVWNIGSLRAGDTASIVITATAKKAGSVNVQSKLTADNNISLSTAVKQTKINKYIKLSYANSYSKTTIRQKQSMIMSTTIKNAGKDTSDKVTVRVQTTKGLKVVNVDNKAKFNKNTKTWTVTVPAGKSVKLQAKVTGVKKGTNKVAFTVNGKKQIKTVKVTK